MNDSSSKVKNQTSPMFKAYNSKGSSPLLQNSPLLSLYKASLAATLICSPLLAQDVLCAFASSPLLQLSPAVSGAQSSTFSKPRSTLTTPVQRPSAMTQQTPQSFFQFPPPELSSAMAYDDVFSTGFNSPFLNAVATKAPSKNACRISQSPEPLNTPVFSPVL